VIDVDEQPLASTAPVGNGLDVGRHRRARGGRVALPDGVGDLAVTVEEYRWPTG